MQVAGYGTIFNADPQKIYQVFSVAQMLMPSKHKCVLFCSAKAYNETNKISCKRRGLQPNGMMMSYLKRDQTKVKG